ncbi:MAG: hypothetical protein ACRDQ5_00890 [Sciscionella sp.]
MVAADTGRAELTALTDEQKHRVLRQVRREHLTCGGCGNQKLLVGDALYLGFLFLSEDQDAYMVALTCTNPHCPAPRGGIRLHAAQFLP